MTPSSNKFLYVICESAESSSVKIGFSVNPDKRVRQLQTGHATKLSVFYKEEVSLEKVRALEAIIHRVLSHRRQKGEWFSITPAEAVAEIRHAIIRYGDMDNLSTRLRGGSLVL